MADSPLSVDGVTTPDVPPAPPKKAPEQPKLAPEVRRWEKLLLIGASILYAGYIFWAFFLMSALPSTNTAMRPLMLAGLLSAAVAALVFLVTGGLLLMHIGQSRVEVDARKRGLIRLIIFVVPGLLISAFMPYVISREPGVSIDIVNPKSSEEWIAPVVMSFSLDTALPVLAQNGFSPISYKWDINGDRKVDQETVIPKLTATYDREGVYTLSVTMIGANGQTRNASRRFIIKNSVFGISPSVPIIAKPVVFSVAGLVKTAGVLESVQWDFDGDGKADETSKSAQSSYTYFKLGQYTVSALVSLTNKTQATYQRTITVQEPPVLPFPVEIVTQPTHLIGSAPFAVLFSVNTKEPVVDVQWDFGDGEKGTGLRAAHTYNENGNYAVEVKVRSESGVTAILNEAVQVVDELQLPDLTFEGTPKPSGDTIQGEVPLTLNLTPKTNTAFVDFSWEAPDATEVGTTDTGLQAIYRRDGNYTLTLVAQDLNNHVLRKTFKVIVKPPSALVTIKTDPETGVSPLLVNFDASETSIPGDDPTGFIWNFGDGSPEITQGASTSHLYTIPKTYTIGLTVQTVSGKSYRATAALVVRAPVLIACMTRSRENVQAGSSVQFYSDCTTGTPANYLWDFGDDSQASDKNPVHLYTEPGTYTVKLTIDDGRGNKNTTSTSLIVQP